MEWWRKFWDGWAGFFGYEEWVWGSAADWFGAVGTVGALALGVGLFLADRREKRSRQAREFECIVTTHFGEDAEGEVVSWRADAHNRSSGRIPQAVLRWRTKGLGKKRWWVSPFYGETDVLQGFEVGEHGVAGFNIRAPHTETTVFAEILDSDGNSWLRDHAGKWASARQTKKILKEPTKVYQIPPNHIAPRHISLNGPIIDNSTFDLMTNSAPDGPVIPPGGDGIPEPPSVK